MNLYAAPPVAPPLDYAAQLERVADHIAALGSAPPDLDALYEALRQVNLETGDWLTDLLFIKRYPTARLLRLETACRALAGQIRATFREDGV